MVVDSVLIDDVIRHFVSRHELQVVAKGTRIKGSAWYDRALENCVLSPEIPINYGFGEMGFEAIEVGVVEFAVRKFMSEFQFL